MSGVGLRASASGPRCPRSFGEPERVGDTERREDSVQVERPFAQEELVGGTAVHRIGRAPSRMLSALRGGRPPEAEQRVRDGVGAALDALGRGFEHP